MDFLSVGFLALLVVVPILVVGYWLSLRRRRPTGARYSSLSLIRAALPGASRLRRHLPFVLFAVAVGSLAIAFARPAVVLSVPANETTIILTIDVSGSMCSTDIAPTRLQAAEAAAIAFVKSQGARTQIGIVAFSGFAAVVQPPTTDQQTLIDALQSLTTGRRTGIGSGILAAIDAIAEVDPSVQRSVIDGRAGVAPVPVPKGAYAPDIIVLLTDGVNNTGPQPVDAAQQAADRGVRVYTIGFGTASGAGLEPTCASQFLGREPNFGFGGGGFPGGGGLGGGQSGGFRRGIDEATLQQVASLTGGAYYPAENATQLEQVFAGLPTTLITKHEVVDVSVFLVGLGGLLSAAALLLGKAWRPLP
jgi:Ca-activated chloride channel family protein